jgi:hypothetical protein
MGILLSVSVQLVLILLIIEIYVLSVTLVVSLAHQWVILIVINAKLVLTKCSHQLALILVLLNCTHLMIHIMFAALLRLVSINIHRLLKIIPRDVLMVNTLVTQLIHANFAMLLVLLVTLMQPIAHLVLVVNS